MANKKTIAVHSGHNCAKAKVGCGAIGFHNESEVARKITKYCRKRLKVLGYIAPNVNSNYASSVGENLREIVANTEKVNPCLSVSIHLNASTNPTSCGSEVFTTSNHKNDRLALLSESICASLNKQHFTNRGHKLSDHLYVLNCTTMPSILVECYFCTSKEDCNKANFKAIGYAIAECIAKYY